MRETVYTENTSLAKTAAGGVIGGIIGTIVMDLFGFGLFLLLSGPASLSMSIIGDAAAGFLAAIGISVAGGTPLGAVLHYLIGAVLGVIFAIAIRWIDALRAASLRRMAALSIVYVELMSLPMLAAAAIILKMTPTETAQWFGISFVMHLVYGFVLGLVVRYRLPHAHHELRVHTNAR